MSQPFSNGTEFMCWYESNCDKCQHEGVGNGCPLVGLLHLDDTGKVFQIMSDPKTLECFYKEPGEGDVMGAAREVL
ncbi:hypothetical protein OAF54_02995, partial [bacterium]|nr:hypothetical protein [bacterium]